MSQHFHFLSAVFIIYHIYCVLGRKQSCPSQSLLLTDERGGEVLLQPECAQRNVMDGHSRVNSPTTFQEGKAAPAEVSPALISERLKSFCHTHQKHESASAATPNSSAAVMMLLQRHVWIQTGCMLYNLRHANASIFKHTVNIEQPPISIITAALRKWRIKILKKYHLFHFCVVSKHRCRAKFLPASDSIFCFYFCFSLLIQPRWRVAVLMPPNRSRHPRLWSVCCSLAGAGVKTNGEKWNGYAVKSP